MKYLKKFSEHSDYLNLLPNDLPNISYCEQEDELHYNLYTSSNKTNFINLYFTTVALESGTINFTLFSWADTTYVESFAYSKNDGEWVETQNSDNREEDIVISVSVIEGDKIRWKGIANHIGNDGDNGGVFTSTCRFDAQGNIMSLLYGDNFKNKVTLENDDSFSFLFGDINSGDICQIVNASNLIIPATTLTARCYYSMFQGCTNLITPPKLSATTLTEGCYTAMFNSCTSLTTAPELSSTTLARQCYQSMFYGCTSLTTAPELPATVLVYYCYAAMFRDCTNLTIPPELPATTLADSCYSEMFNGCTNLNYIKCLATDISAHYCTNSWVQGVASSGTFVKADGVDWTTGINGIPEGWNVYTEDDLKAVKHYELNESELAISAALNDLNSRVSLTEITWAELKELRDNSNLVPGKLYRIIDYVTTTIQKNTRSASHLFDIIVRADSADTLNLRAWAVKHEGDTYFKNTRLEAWELKYMLDNIQWSQRVCTIILDENDGYNATSLGTVDIDGETYILWDALEFTADYDITRMVSLTIEVGAEMWIYNPVTGKKGEDVQTSIAAIIGEYTEDGKGTITWMQDEFGNECPYDFKNILFKRFMATDAKSGRNGIDGKYMVAMNWNFPKDVSIEDEGDYIWAYTFSSDNSGGDQTDFSLGGHNVHDNVFKPYGDLLPNNVMFGGNTYGNSFGFNCYCNSCGSCKDNSWGNSCLYNSLGVGCSNNYLDSDCSNNSLGNYCFGNSYGNSFVGNSWGNSCLYNSLGVDCRNNSWGNEVMYSTVFDSVKYTQITTERVKNVQVLNGVKGTSSNKLTLAFAANKTYTQVACMTSAGALKIYVPGDLS